jgi:hypothetical protein
MTLEEIWAKWLFGYLDPKIRKQISEEDTQKLLESWKDELSEYAMEWLRKNPDAYLELV